jgi:phosphoribosylaminoimidazolecarboxamide formyltransferase/IMP cyclohydrolase
VWVVVDPADYPRVLEAMDGTEDEAAFRRELATKVFEHTSVYDAAIAAYLGAAESDASAGEESLPSGLCWQLERARTLRYGENPDQKAAYYVTPGSEAVGLTGLEQLHGKELSYNNLLDLDGALLSLTPFAFSPTPAVCIIKHTTPCGLAVGNILREAYEAALRTDPVSSFGSVIAVNRAVDGSTAEAMSNLFIECIVAPGFADEALAILREKKNLRLLTFPQEGAPPEGLAFEPEGDPWWAGAGEELKQACRFIAAHNQVPEPVVLRSVYGGVLAQSPPNPPYYGVVDGSWKVVSERQPTERELDDLRFAWAAIFGVKSNAILLARDGGTLGIGAGQMSRVDSSKIAVRKAGDAGLRVEGAALASDAFFPFRDGVDAAAEAGVKAIVEPGGSVRDEEVIQAANEHGIALVFTGRSSRSRWSALGIRAPGTTRASAARLPALPGSSFRTGTGSCSSCDEGRPRGAEDCVCTSPPLPEVP